MGFFSWICASTKCDKSIRYNKASGERWLCEAVLIQNNMVFHGIYNGYGVIGTIDIYDAERKRKPNHNWGKAVCLWHLQCWKKAGKPRTFIKSKRAEDQGFF